MSGDNKQRIPARAVERPNPEDWQPFELMPLPEAAAVFFPSGLIKTGGLRRARALGQLAVAVIGRKHLTHRSAVEEMSRSQVVRRTVAPATEPARTHAPKDEPTGETQLARVVRRHFAKRL